VGQIIPIEQLTRRILILRSQRVMLSTDLAALYEVEPKALMQAVKRNAKRFPQDFMFQLNAREFERLRSRSVTAKSHLNKSLMKVRFAPYAFTQEGIAMLSSVLRSARAIRVNIAIMRAFVQLRQMLLSHKELAQKLAALERKYDAQFTIVFDAIRQLMNPPVSKERRIGFGQL
jgi:ORF6N domain-containing protein